MASDTPISFLQRFGQQRRIVAYLVFAVVFLISLNDRSDISLFSFKSLFFLVLMLAMPYLQFKLANYLLKRYGKNHQIVALTTYTDFDYAKNLQLMWPLVCIDAVCVGLAIGYLQFSLTPSLIFMAMLVVRLVELNSLLFSIVSIIICVLSAYISAHILGVDIQMITLNDNAMHDGSALLRVGSIICFATYIIFALNYAEKHVGVLKKKFIESEKKNHQYIKMANKIARYAPSQVWQAIVNGTFESRIYNKRKKLTIFFSDIEGFTELSDRLSSDDLAALLNTYFEKMSNIARKYGGTIDKFVGDALVIFFGDPTSSGTKNDAIACIDMAIAMQQEMKRLRQKSNNSELGQLHVRMGVTTGYCHVGNFGSASRMSYTVIGREANLAARLQAAAAPNEILMSQETYEQVRDQVNCIDQGEIMLRGIAQPVQAWQVAGRYENVPTHQRRWSEYELEGFNLQLDMDLVKTYDRDRIKRALQHAIENLDRPGQ